MLHKTSVCIDIKVPTTWADLTQPQLAMLYRVMAKVNTDNASRPFTSPEDCSIQSAAQIAMLCIMQWNNLKTVCPYGSGWLIRSKELKVEFTVSIKELTAVAWHMLWIRKIPPAPVRLDTIDGARAVDPDLDDSFTFDNWLSCETLWQVFLVSHEEECLRRMAEILYHKPGIRLREFERLSVFYWWASLKNLCNERYPNFFIPAPASGDDINEDSLRRSMDSQIRALTKGDITKEALVLSMPAHRALTELDALAKEFDDLNTKYKS